MKEQVKTALNTFGLNGDMEVFQVIFGWLASAEEIISTAEMIVLNGDATFDLSLEQSRKLASRFAADLRSVAPQVAQAINLANVIFPEVIWDMKKAFSWMLVKMKALPEDRSLYGYFDTPADVTAEQVINFINEVEYILVHMYDRDRAMDLVRAARNCTGTLRVKLPKIVKLVRLISDTRNELTAKFAASLGETMQDIVKSL
jgi:hypothetical protein